jgi:hypothetical protein
MTLRDAIQEKIIRSFVRPFGRTVPLEFKKALKKSARLLVVLPASSALQIAPKTMRQMESVFPSSRFTFIHPGSPAGSGEKDYGRPILYLHLKKNTVGQLRKSHVMSGLNLQSFDTLLDLDPEFSLVGAYLARKVGFPLCIGFTKPFSSRYYNLLFTGRSESSIDDRVSELFRFIKSFVSRG